MGDVKSQMQQDTVPQLHPKGSYVPHHHQEGTVLSQASVETWLKQCLLLFILNCLQKKSTEHQQDHISKGTTVRQVPWVRGEALLKWDSGPHVWMLHLRKPLMAPPGQRLYETAPTHK